MSEFGVMGSGRSLFFFFLVGVSNCSIYKVVKLISLLMVTVCGCSLADEE